MNFDRARPGGQGLRFAIAYFIPPVSRFTTPHRPPFFFFFRVFEIKLIPMRPTGNKSFSTRVACFRNRRLPLIIPFCPRGTCRVPRNDPLQNPLVPGYRKADHRRHGCSGEPNGPTSRKIAFFCYHGEAPSQGPQGTGGSVFFRRRTGFVRYFHAAPEVASTGRRGPTRSSGLQRAGHALARRWRPRWAWNNERPKQLRRALLLSNRMPGEAFHPDA